jgi:hypothetical protein
MLTITQFKSKFALSHGDYESEIFSFDFDVEQPRWIQIAFVRKGNYLEGWIDGKLIKREETWNGDIVLKSAVTCYGRDDTLGLINSQYVFPLALSSQDIRYLYNDTFNSSSSESGSDSTNQLTASSPSVTNLNGELVEQGTYNNKPYYKINNWYVYSDMSGSSYAIGNELGGVPTYTQTGTYTQGNPEGSYKLLSGSDTTIYVTISRGGGVTEPDAPSDEGNGNTSSSTVVGYRVVNDTDSRIIGDFMDTGEIQNGHPIYTYGDYVLSCTNNPPANPAYKGWNIMSRSQGIVAYMANGDAPDTANWYHSPSGDFSLTVPKFEKII